MNIAIAFIAAAGPVQEPIDFQLGWKQGEKLAYAVVINIEDGDENGDVKIKGMMEITVTKAGGNGFTVSWPEITFAGQSRPYAAGTLQLNRYGRVVSKGALTDVSSHFGQMPLPEKPVAVGDEFKVKYTRDRLVFDLVGKLDKIDETKGRLAHFSFTGRMQTPAFGDMQVELRTVFDVARGRFISSELDVVKYKIQQILTLVEKSSRE